MPVANQFTDGTVNRYNSVSLTITNPTGAVYTSAAITAIAESLEITRAYSKILVKNHLNVPVGSQYTIEPVNGRATIQAVPSKDVEPGATFSATLNGASESFFIHTVSTPFEQGGIVKQNITFDKVLSAIA